MMNIAFHFDVEAIRATYQKQPYKLPILERIFQALLLSDLKHIHLKIFDGDLLIWDLIRGKRNAENIGKTLEELLALKFSIWRDVNERFIQAILSRSVYVVALEGVSPLLRDSLLHSLKKESSYLGTIQIYGANRLHWNLYGQSLVPQYRYIDKELRIFYTTLDDFKDTGLEEHWQRLPFKTVSWEDLGTRHTIFDAYDSFEQAKRLATLNDNLSDHLNLSDFLQQADEILIRTGDLNAKLQNELHAAFRTFNFVETLADVAQVAVSCRRFLEYLANALYSTIEDNEPFLDRCGKPIPFNPYLKKLERYINQKIGTPENETVKAEMENLRTRIGKVNSLANKSVHGLDKKITSEALVQLLVALITITYDILSLAPPPIELPMEPHEEAFIEIFEEVKKSYEMED
jgi:hypothetical protein